MIAKFNKAPVKATCQVQALKRGLKFGAPVIRKTKAERLTRAYERQKKLVIIGAITYNEKKERKKILQDHQ